MTNRLSFDVAHRPPAKADAEFYAPPAWVVVGLALVVCLGPLLGVVLAGWVRSQGGYQTLVGALSLGGGL